jgi:hypothetical protein
MAKIDFGKLVAVVVAAGSAQVAGDNTTKMEPKDAAAVVKATDVAIKQSPEIKEAQATVDVLTNQEPFYMSVQWWTGLLSLIVAAAGVFGVVIPEEIQKQVLAIIAIMFGSGGVGLMVYNRYIRFRGVVK